MNPELEFKLRTSMMGVRATAGALGVHVTIPAWTLGLTCGQWVDIANRCHGVDVVGSSERLVMLRLSFTAISVKDDGGMPYDHVFDYTTAIRTWLLIEKLAHDTKANTVT